METRETTAKTEPSGNRERAGFPATYDYSRNLVISLSGVFYERKTMRKVDPSKICECGHLHDNPQTKSCTNYLEDASGFCPCERFERQAKGWAVGIEARPDRWPVLRNARFTTCPGCMKRVLEKSYAAHREECTGVRVSPWSNRPGAAMKPLNIDDIRQALGRESAPLGLTLAPPPMSGTQVVSSASRGRFVNDGKFDTGLDWALEPDQTFVVVRVESGAAQMDIAKIEEAVRKLKFGKGDIKSERKPFVEKPRTRLVGDEE